MMKPIRILGGASLGQRRPGATTTTAAGSSWEPLVSRPISPPPQHQHEQQQERPHHDHSPQRFILLPQERFIIVLSYATGKRLGVLVLEDADENDLLLNDNDKNNKTTTTNASETKLDEEASSLAEKDQMTLECAVLACMPSSSHAQDSFRRYPMDDARMDGPSLDVERLQEEDEEYLYVGCNQGHILEFSMTRIAASLSTTTRGPKHAWYNLADGTRLPGPIVYPHRRLQIANASSPITALTVPQSTSTKSTTTTNHHHAFHDDQDNHQEPIGLECWALVQTKVETSTHRTTVVTESLCTMTRIRIPPPSSSSSSSSGDHETVDVNLTTDPSSVVQSFSPPLSFRCICSKSSHRVVSLRDSTHLVQWYSFLVPEGVLILLGRPTELQVTLYPWPDDTNHPNDKDSQQPHSCVTASYVFSPTDALTALVPSPNGLDIACGHASGRIYLVKNFIPLYHQYLVQQLSWTTTTTTTTTITLDNNHTDHKNDGLPDIRRRRLHWHAHAVATLAFESASVAEEPFLYSGGLEAVLCGWHLARGQDKPSWTLPRLGLQGIAHIRHLAASNNDDTGAAATLLVTCAKESLQLVNAHNLKVQWKTSVVSTADPHHIKNHAHPWMQLKAVPSTRTDASSSLSCCNKVALFGGPESSGMVQWLDPPPPQDHDHEDASMLEEARLDVAPYNRVSKTEPKDVELPMPFITHAVWDGTGTILLTLDVMCTHVYTMGTTTHTNHNLVPSYGSITSLKFWSYHNNQYHVVAELSSPHGKNHSVCAATLSERGTVACTLSPEEQAFRIWERRRSPPQPPTADQFDTELAAPWFCRYRIEVPSGFANHVPAKVTTTCPTSFSSDDSTLAIGLGNHVTLWDVDQQVLLVSLPHSDTTTAIQRVLFLPSTSKFCDMMLTWSKRHVTFHSPFGQGGPLNLGWTWSVPPPHASAAVVISCVEYILPQELVAVTLYHPPNHNNNKNDRNTGTSVLWLMDVERGTVVSRGTKVQVPGKVMEMASLTNPSSTAAANRDVDQDSWGEDSTVSTSSSHEEVDLMFVVREGGIYRWFSGNGTRTPDRSKTTPSNTTTTSVATTTTTSRSIPSLQDHMSSSSHDRKRPREALSFWDRTSAYGAAAAKLSVESFGLGDGTDDVPLLAGAFGTAFLSRNLRRVQRPRTMDLS